MQPTSETSEAGLKFGRHFSQEGVPPVDAIPWATAYAAIKDDKGRVIFEQQDVRVPASYSQIATNVVVSKFFYGDKDKPGERETGVDQLVDRVADTIAHHGFVEGYFGDYYRNRDVFRDELKSLLLGQHSAFNSPVWFNVGLSRAYGVVGGNDNYQYEPLLKKAIKVSDSYERPQGSACFIQSVDDTMEAIMELAGNEARLFKYGSGTGTDLSTLRSSREKLSGGGRPSGPVSFMRVFDSVAGVVKSGGKCLAPYQPVFTAGGVKSAKELAEAGEDFTVLSFSCRQKRVAAKTARAWQSGEKEVWALTTDKGEFHLSADHPFMLRTGEFVELEDLKPGMSLMASKTYPHPMGYVTVGLQDGKGGRDLLHRMVARDVMGLDIEDKIVHHGKAGKLNSEPGNISLIDSQSEHAARHNNELVAAGTHVFQNRVFNHAGEANGMHASSPFWKDESKVNAYKEKQGTILKDSGRAVDMQAAARRVKMLNTGYSLINIGQSIETFEEYVAARKAVGRRCPSVPGQLKKFEREFGSYAAFYDELRRGNHEVVAIRRLGVMPVYDIEVDDPSPDTGEQWDEHNFALMPVGQVGECGTCLYVHNTRRAAKMQTLKVWHPDIMDFINCKSNEEKKARALIAQGYDPNFNGEAYSSVCFQNANLSIRVTDKFLAAVEADDDWSTVAVTDGRVVETMPAATIMKAICDGTWFCGDPGLQFEDTINDWHTCPNTAPINASNPCFTGDTLVDTSEGRIPIARLAEMASFGAELPMAFAFDLVSGQPVLRQINRAWMTKRVKSLATVTTDKGLSFTCTPDHKFLTYDGRYVPASELTAGTRLRKINRHVYADGRAKLILPGKSNAAWQHRWMWEQANGPIPVGMEVHHSNDDKSDDRLKNFELLPSGEHQSIHFAGDRNPRYMDRDVDLIVATYEALESRMGRIPSSASWNRHVQANGLTGRLPQFSGNARKHNGQTWGEFVEWIVDQQAAVNDKVASVTLVEADEPVPVYDLEVEGTHNFAVACVASTHSIVVHNCSEYMFIDDSACNLSSINLMKFRREDGTFDAAGFRAACRIMFIGQEILVGLCSYPTAKIAENSYKFRPLGLGYANLGGLLMSIGLPYDSDEARDLAGAITANMQAAAWEASAEMAAVVGAFEGHAANKEPMARVLEKHMAAAADSRFRSPSPAVTDLWNEAIDTFLRADALGRQHGYRNSQMTVLAPTGTIAFMMDCDTTGIEPDIALVKYKSLAGGGMLKIVNQLVPLSLRTLGYDERSIEGIVAYVEKNDTIEGAPGLKDEHLPVFDCAFPPPQGGRSIAWGGHVKMMAAAQRFISGAISKTVNVPNEATVDDIKGAYLLAWKLGLKAIAIYRDGSKGSQPVTTKKVEEHVDVNDPAWRAARFTRIDDLMATVSAIAGVAMPPENLVTDEWLDAATARLRELSKNFVAGMGVRPKRIKMPIKRKSETRTIKVGQTKCYVTVGFYEDGQVGEIFIGTDQGSTVGGFADAVAQAISIALQYGVPFETFVEKYSHSKFEPSGITNHPEDVPFATSLLDGIMRILACDYVPGFREAQRGKNLEMLPYAPPPAAIDLPFAELPKAHVVDLNVKAGVWGPAPAEVTRAVLVPSATKGAPPCDNCGAITVRCGTCYRCANCGQSMGCS